MLPLKPPIKQKPYPLRRAKSQQEAFSSQVGENVDEEHIYDDADLSFKTRRIVSRENVAYEMEDGQQEYELLWNTYYHFEWMASADNADTV